MLIVIYTPPRQMAHFYTNRCHTPDRGLGRLDPTCPGRILNPSNGGTSPSRIPTPVETTPTSRRILGIRSLQSFNYPSHYVRHANALGYISAVGNRSNALTKNDATWRVVPGLANGNCVSFESRNYPGYYLRHENARIKLRRGENTSLFRDTATFCPRAGLANSGATSFESFNYPGHYIRHYNSELWVVRQANDNVYRQDATFQAMAPWVP